MTFYDVISVPPSEGISRFIENVTNSQVLAALSKPELTSRDFLALLSTTAANHLEEMAQAAHGLTVRHFGWTIQLYTPLYLANYCVNHCIYCGFNTNNKIPRRKLSFAEVELEAQAIAKSGLKHILVLTGESRRFSPVSYIRDCISILKKYFTSISIEIYPLSIEEYYGLIAAGADGLTIYQEVYNEEIYKCVHPRGPKSNYGFRLEAPERAGEAGIRTINIGALLGLNDWRSEVFLTGLHAAYLQKRFPNIEVSISFPRIRPQYGGYHPEFPLTDRDLVQCILASRLFLPQAGITISTRESALMRDNLVRLGVTKMSAGSSTVIGGHTDDTNGTGQFEISDRRSVEEMRKALSNLGYRPVLKDWHNLDTGGITHDKNKSVSGV